VLPVSLLVALLLMLMPLPPAVQPLRPYWLALVLAYWVIENPDHVGLGVAFIIGLLGDLVTGSLFGEQALRLVVMAYILQRFRARLRFFPMSQQALAIGGLLLNDCIVTAAIHIAVGSQPLHPLRWLSPVTGMVLWPLAYVALDSLRHGRWRAR
jgi:rod shape-determining protein MreD